MAFLAVFQAAGLYNVLFCDVLCVCVFGFLSISYRKMPQLIACLVGDPFIQTRLFHFFLDQFGIVVSFYLGL